MSIFRGSLPSEFVDVTSAMMLVAPEPQYLYAAMWLQAMNGTLNLENALRNGLDVAENMRSLGVSGANVEAFSKNQLMLEPDPIMGGFFTSVAELGKPAGHIVRVNRPNFTNTTYTEASREIGSNTTITTTPIGVSNTQVPITCRRFGGPYDATNSRVAPIGIDAFDSMIALHKVAQRVGMELHRDHSRFHETVIATLFDNASNTVRPDGFTADNDSLTAGDAPMDVEVLEKTALALNDANVPVGPDGRRIMVLHPRQVSQLLLDPRWERRATGSDTKPVNPLLARAYKGSDVHFHIFQSTSLRSAANSSSVSIYKGHAFGPGAFGTAVAMLPEVRKSDDTNYGETAKAMWLEYAGFNLLDASFAACIRTS